MRRAAGRQLGALRPLGRGGEYGGCRRLWAETLQDQQQKREPEKQGPAGAGCSSRRVKRGSLFYFLIQVYK